MLRSAKEGKCPECGCMIDTHSAKHFTKINIEDAVHKYFGEYKRTHRDIDFADIIHFIETLGISNEFCS